MPRDDMMRSNLNYKVEYTNFSVSTPIMFSLMECFSHLKPKYLIFRFPPALHVVLHLGQFYSALLLSRRSVSESTGSWCLYFKPIIFTLSCNSIHKLCSLWLIFPKSISYHSTAITILNRCIHEWTLFIYPHCCKYCCESRTMQKLYWKTDFKPLEMLLVCLLCHVVFLCELI